MFPWFAKGICLRINADVVEDRYGMRDRAYAVAVPRELTLGDQRIRRIRHHGNMHNAAMKRRIGSGLILFLVYLLPRLIFSRVNVHVAEARKDQVIATENMVHLLTLLRPRNIRDESGFRINRNNSPKRLSVMWRNESLDSYRFHVISQNHVIH